MAEKKFIKIVLTSIIILITTVYILGQNTIINQKSAIDIYYTHAGKKEMQEFKETKSDNFMWYELERNEGKLNTLGEKYVILKFTLDDIYSDDKIFRARFRNKVVEVYVDGVLVQRNGEVASGQFLDNMTTYYDISMPITPKNTGKEVYILMESPTKIEATSIESAEVISSADVFRNRDVIEVTMVFFAFIAMAITGLVALYMFWMRLNFANVFYRVLLPTWTMLGFLILSLPYYNINFPKYEQQFSAVAYFLGITSLFLIMYGLRKTAKNPVFIRIMSFVIIVLWMGVATSLVVVRTGVVNWCFLHYVLECLIILLAFPMCFIGYTYAKSADKMFEVPLKIFWCYSALLYIGISLWYYFFNFLSIGDALSFVVFGILVGIIVFVSYIMTVFHLNLFKEMKFVISESEVYDSIDISRDNVFYDKKRKNKEVRKHEYNNLSVKYAKALINAEMYACSLILKPKPETDEIEIVYCKNTFENTEITQEEAKYYLILFDKIFDNKDSNTVRRGKNVYLGFKQDNLYYFMIISPKDEIGDLKFKALTSYTSSIKNTAYNYVITNYIEKAQSDVIRSFGETIEARISSNNVIGITDRFVEFIARAMGKGEGEVQTLKTASYIKNIGTIIMSDSYVKDFHLKTDAEIIEAFKRATYGYDILQKFDDIILNTAAIMSKYQFENYDGSGYLGTKREEIPDESKIIKIAVGMTSALRNEVDIERLYEQVMEHIESEKFVGQFSPYIIKKLMVNSHLFKDSFDITDEELVKLIHEQRDKNAEDFIM